MADGPMRQYQLSIPLLCLTTPPYEARTLHAMPLEGVEVVQTVSTAETCFPS